jgi:Uma2 family endonuclease
LGNGLGYYGDRMTLPAPRHRYSFKEYLELEEVARVRHEFYRGEIYAMAGGTPEHAAMAAAITAILGRQLDPKSCRAYSSDLRVRVLATGLATYPDVTVICGASQRDPESATHVTNPKLVVEVLSHSTADYDRDEKLEHYRQIPSLDVLVSWNFRHIVRLDKIRLFNAVNIEQGYKALTIYSPQEVTIHGRDPSDQSS